MGTPRIISAVTPRRALRHTGSWRTTLAFWSFVGPFLLGLIVFTYIPILWGLVLSFSEARLTITPTNFVGLEHYIYLLTDRVFLRSLGTFTLFALCIVPATYLVSLGLALLVDSIGIGRSFFRSVFFLPTACSYVVASLVWKMSLFSSLPSGFANMALSWIDVDPVRWLSTLVPPFYWVPLVSARLWLQTGFYMIIFMAGLQEIPRELYEAAQVDGARRGWQTFRYITLPLLRNTSISVVVLLIIAAFQAFDEFYNLLGSSSGTGSLLAQVRPPMVYLYQIAFGDQNYGRGSAGAFIIMAVIILFTLLQNRIFGIGQGERSKS